MAPIDSIDARDGGHTIQAGERDTFLHSLHVLAE